MLLIAVAHAYETDQITDRLVPLADITVAADAEVDRLLALAIERTNQRTSCQRKDPATERILAGEIYRVTSQPEYVRDRGELAGFGYGAYSAWLETAPELVRRSFQDRDDIYGDVGPGESVVLSAAGVCSTVRIAGVLMGTDKLDHFWSQGFDYYVASRFGKAPIRAVRWGTRSERGTYGLLTSDAFSWADLYANWQGYTFYDTLLGPGSVLVRGEDGCVRQARPWRWSEWLDEAADEAVNPPTYTDEVAEIVRMHLQSRRGEVCAEYAQWGPEVARQWTAVAAREQNHVARHAPPRVDEWQLGVLCADELRGRSKRSP